jgi:hypothetical protein
LHRFRILEPWQLGAQITGGAVDEDGDGTADSIINATYDGERLMNLNVERTGGGEIDFVFSYTCD